MGAAYTKALIQCCGLSWEKEDHKPKDVIQRWNDSSIKSIRNQVYGSVVKGFDVEREICRRKDCLEDLSVRKEKTHSESVDEASQFLETLQGAMNENRKAMETLQEAFYSEHQKVQHLEQRVHELEDSRDLILLASEDASEKHRCQICFDNYRDTLILPCMHFQFCAECLEGLKPEERICPTCRGDILDIFQLNV